MYRCASFFYVYFVIGIRSGIKSKLFSIRTSWTKLRTKCQRHTLLKLRNAQANPGVWRHGSKSVSREMPLSRKSTTPFGSTPLRTQRNGWYSHPEQSNISAYVLSPYMHAIALREYESLMSELDACMKTPTMEKQAHSLLVVPPSPLPSFPVLVGRSRFL